MQLPSLVTSVPDLHIARILAAAGVPYIAFRQHTENLEDIIPWLEGPLIGIEMIYPDQSIPATDFLIMPAGWYDLFSFSSRTIFWKTDGVGFNHGDMIIYKGALMTATEIKEGRRFYHYSDYCGSEDVTAKAWLDYEEDLSLFEELFLKEK